MSKYATDFLESEAILAMIVGDLDEAERILERMSRWELKRLRAAITQLQSSIAYVISKRVDEAP